VHWRLIESSSVSSKDFDSHQCRKPKAKYPDPCRARGVSLAVDWEACVTLSKLARMKKYKYAAEVALSVQSGAIDQDSRKHVTWWVSKSCDPVKLIRHVEEIK